MVRMGSLRRLRDVVGDALSVASVTAPRRRAAGRLSIATFHRVLPEAERRAYPIPGLVVTPSELSWFVSYFTRHFTVGTLASSWRRFATGDHPARPLLALTFDDGQLDNFVHARPVLDRWAVKASFYVPSAHIDSQQPIWHDLLGFALRRGVAAGRVAELAALLGAPVSVERVPALIDGTKSMTPEARQRLVADVTAIAPGDVPAWSALMSWAQLRELARDGHEVGAHSVTHALLPQCSDQTLIHEVAGSKRAIESALELEVTTFCYPNGDSDARVERAVEAAGYACAVTTRWGSNDVSQPRYALRRCDINAEHARRTSGALSASRLAWRMSGLHPGLG